MSTWWRTCPECGEGHQDPWRCEWCGAPIRLRDSNRDWDLMTGVFIAVIAVVGFIAVLVLAIQIALGGHP